MTTTMTVRFDGKVTTVGSIAEAVQAWETYRDDNGLGASDCAGADVFDGETKVAHISYNGRVWK